MEKWYPAPYTIGREFDYELLRRYGLRNAQEGIQYRTLGLNDEKTTPLFYVVGYAFNPAPQKNGFSVENYIFGRVRVSKFTILK